MQTESLAREEFLELHQEILRKFREECRKIGVSPPKTKYQIYGYGDYDKDQPSILAFMMDHPEVRAYLNENNKGKKKEKTGYTVLSAKALYDNWRKAEKQKVKEVFLSPPYDPVYYLFIDCENKEEFLSRFFAESFSNKVQYVGLYFDPVSLQVNEYDLNITFKREECHAELRGFHKRLSSSRFEGDGRVVGRTLFLNLANPDGLGFSLFLAVEGGSVTELAFLQGLATTVSSSERPISVHTVLIRMEDHQPVLTDEYRKLFGRYLVLHRQSIFSPRINLRDPGRLYYGSTRINSFEDMVGTYWVWRYHDSGDMVQIKLEIKEDFTATIQHPVYRAEDQIGVMTLSTLYNYCVCIATFDQPEDYRHPDLISYGIIEVPEREDKEKRYLSGVYVTVGNTGGSPNAGFMELYKEEHLNTNLTPQIIPQDQIKSHIVKNQELAPLQTELVVKYSAIQSILPGQSGDSVG